MQPINIQDTLLKSGNPYQHLYSKRLDFFSPYCFRAITSCITVYYICLSLASNGPGFSYRLERTSSQVRTILEEIFFVQVEITLSVIWDSLWVCVPISQFTTFLEVKILWWPAALHSDQVVKPIYWLPFWSVLPFD